MDLQEFDVELMDTIFPKIRLSSDPGEAGQIAASRNDPSGFASCGRGMSSYGDDTHIYGLEHEGKKHRIDTSCFNYTRAVPLAAVGELSETRTSGCTCSFPGAKRIKQGDLELKQDTFESSWEADSHSQDANSNLFSITEHSALAPDLAKDFTVSEGAFTSFGDFIFPDDLPSLQQEVGHVADGKSSHHQPLDGSFGPYDYKVDEKALVLKGNAPTAQQWEIMKPHIMRLYVEVLSWLGELHGFSASRSQVTRRLSEWGFQKNFKQQERRVILECLSEDASSSSAGEVKTTLLRGRKLDSDKLKRWRGQMLESERATAPAAGRILPEMVQGLKTIPENQTPTFKQLLVDQSSFACPFAKKDPLKYRSCLDFTLKRIRDVKQHLNRVHPLPIYCSRCMCILGSEDQRDEHIRASLCDVQSGITYEGVTMAQKAQLTQKVSSKITSEDQWFTIFDILFPSQISRPKSAYKSMTVALDGFQDLTYAEGPDIVLKAMLSRGLRFAKSSNSESDQSGLVLSAIEDGLQKIMQRWTASMQLTLPNASNQGDAAAQEKSNLHTDQKKETPDQLHWPSDKLPKVFSEAKTATPNVLQLAHNKHYEHDVDEFNQVSHLESMQEQTAWLDNNMDAQHSGSTGQTDEPHTRYTDQRSVEPMFNGSIEDGADMWQGFCPGVSFQINSDGAAEGSAQALDSSDLYHQMIENNRMCENSHCMRP